MTNRNDDVADRFAIQALRHAYGRALDERDWRLFESLFTDEVDADFAAFGIPAARVPRSTLVGWMQHAFRRDEMKTHQIYANVDVDLRGDNAICHSSLFGRHRLPGHPGGDDFAIHARYEDRLVRTSAGWKIEGIRLRVLFTEGNVEMLR